MKGIPSQTKGAATQAIRFRFSTLPKAGQIFTRGGVLRVLAISDFRAAVQAVHVGRVVSTDVRRPCATCASPHSAHSLSLTGTPSSGAAGTCLCSANSASAHCWQCSAGTTWESTWFMLQSVQSTTCASAHCDCARGSSVDVVRQPSYFTPHARAMPDAAEYGCAVHPRDGRSFVRFAHDYPFFASRFRARFWVSRRSDMFYCSLFVRGTGSGECGAGLFQTQSQTNSVQSCGTGRARRPGRLDRRSASVCHTRISAHSSLSLIGTPSSGAAGTCLCRANSVSAHTWQCSVGATWKSMWCMLRSVHSTTCASAHFDCAGVAWTLCGRRPTSVPTRAR